ncbi:hypothetical protein BV22DRAFT_1006163 [Leucogyrophana mollusca]|uniref:Uncharacterized protein n=1 Tax=Leucogyrophana mollusca TaxID=85980 RepID=A0ACB8BQU8_9AGAM|nr:hypothetical protein BV22DRAFT_1006163 [Leucogyrophana mollusca]
MSQERLPPWPWKNMTIWRLMSWKMTGSSQKSEAELTRLAEQVLLADDFDVKELRNFNAHTEMKRFDASEEALDPNDVFRKDGWKEVDVEIQVPTRERNTGGNGKSFIIPGFLYRPLTHVIRSAFSEAISKWFHLTPYKRIWRSPVTGREQRLYDELYTSDAWNNAHDDIQKQKRSDGCTLERVIAGLMFWSDSTHLAQFGHAKAWPVYMFFGNLSKYTRACPDSGACHPVAFIPSLPESISGFIANFSKRKNDSDLLTHCKRELFHALWKVLLDDDFIEAYRNGIVIRCYDGIDRRVYPRIFTYSADYPEKILLANVRDKGLCPCPRCFTPKSLFDRLGFSSDLLARVKKMREYLRNKVVAARDSIYKLGVPTKGVAVERLLKTFSAVPTLNTFIERLSPLGFDFYPILVVDLLHEFELGVWKAVFKHLIRMLYAIDPDLINILNHRFRLIPSFGKGAIRRFPTNVSEVRQRAARHFEDILQCAIPSFEGLFPGEHDRTISILLFRLAEWHALAKLRLHSDDSLSQLDRALKNLGSQLRRFRDVTCTAFSTKELPTEAEARNRRMRAAGSKRKPSSSGTKSSGPRPKSFNLLTYKLHALGDYATTIRMFGTTDSYTTQIGELMHRLVKRFYGSTNKKEVSKQLAGQERRHTRMRRQRQSLTTPDFSPLPPELHHNLSDSPSTVINLAQFLREHQEDPSIKNFVPKLKDHLLSRLYDFEYNGDEHHFTDAERNDLRFMDNLNRVFQPKRFQVNYTTYDIRRDQDSMRPGKDCVVMTLSREDGDGAHPFWYARVLRAFHIRVLHVGPNARNRSPQTLEFLWVRWFGVMPGHRWGFKEARLPKIGFVPDVDENAFGFLDPSLVIRGCHLIPAFVNGRSDTLLRPGPSVGRLPEETDDWTAYYVNIFADRDMFARFAGIGIGHEAQFHSPKNGEGGGEGNEEEVEDESGGDEDEDDSDCGSDEDEYGEEDEGEDDDDEDEDEGGAEARDGNGDEDEDEGPGFKF